MASNPRFVNLLKEMEATHNRKNEDYASVGNPYSNFELAGLLASLFSDPVDIAFATLIGVKLARLGELRGSKRAPKNEAVTDTQLDLAVYAALWASYYRKEPLVLPAEVDALVREQTTGAQVI